MTLNPYRNGPFGVPSGIAASETPDGRTTVHNDCCFENNLIPSPFVTRDGIAFSAFPEQDYTKGMVPFRED